MPVNYQQNIKFQNVPEERIDEFQFVGGLVTDPHETKLQPSQSPNLANVIFNDTGSIKTRNGYLRYNGDPVGSSSDESNTGTSTGTIEISAVGDWVAQTFQVGTAADIVQCDFYLAMNTSGEEQYVKAELWSGNTGPDAKLTDAQILLVSGTSETEYSFRFRVPYTLSDSTEYGVVLKPYVRGSTQSVNSVLVHHTGNDYANGAAYSSTDSGLNWSAVSSTDLKFNVYTGATASTGLLRFYTDTGIQQMISKFGTSLYRGTDNTGAMNTITFASGVELSSSAFIDWTVSNNTLLVVDGFNRIKKYRGSTNANYSTGTISVTNGDATVTGSGTSWNTTTNAEVGEYIQLPDSKWYKINSIASNTSLEIEVAYQGSTQSGQSYVISPWGEIQGKLESSTAVTSLIRPTPHYIANHSNRIWTLDGNTLRFSALNTSIDEENFNDWDTLNNAGTIIIPTTQNHSGTGLYSLKNSLYVFQRSAIWAVYGSSPANFELRNITNEIGMIDKRTLVEYDDILVFQSDKGIYMFDGSNLRNISEGVLNTFIDSWANKVNSVATLWNNRYIISYTPSGQSVNSEALFYDFKRQAWGRLTNIYANDWSNWNGGTDSGEIYFASSNQGSIYRFDIGGHDDGYEIETLYDTGSLGFSSGMNDKSIKRVYLQQLALGDWDVNVTQFIDINGSETAGQSINLSDGSAALWDVAQWDVDSWSSEGSIITTRIAEFQGLGKYFKYRIEQSGYDEGVEILGMTLTARNRRLR